jgi:hypothetical protein
MLEVIHRPPKLRKDINVNNIYIHIILVVDAESNKYIPVGFYSWPFLNRLWLSPTCIEINFIFLWCQTYKLTLSVFDHEVELHI